MRRLFTGVSLFIGAALIVSCNAGIVQPIATPVLPTATAQPTTAPVPPAATTALTTAPVPSTATTAPTSSAPPTTGAQATKASATPTQQPSSGGQQKINLDDYFPKSPGRELVLRDCTTCHSFAPVIMGQRPKARWLSLKEDHKDKASGVTSADYDLEFDYLMENFNDTKPEPKLPDWFLKQQPGIGE